MEDSKKAPTTPHEDMGKNPQKYTLIATDTPQAPQEDTEKAPQTPYIDSFMKDPEVLAYITLQIKEGIQEALKGTAPKANTTDPTVQERTAFEKMTYKERLNLFNSNPHSYNKLSKGSV